MPPLLGNIIGFAIGHFYFGIIGHYHFGITHKKSSGNRCKA